MQPRSSALLPPHSFLQSSLTCHVSQPRSRTLPRFASAPHTSQAAEALPADLGEEELLGAFLASAVLLSASPVVAADAEAAGAPLDGDADALAAATTERCRVEVVKACLGLCASNEMRKVRQRRMHSLLACNAVYDCFTAVYDCCEGRLSRCCLVQCTLFFDCAEASSRIASPEARFYALIYRCRFWLPVGRGPTLLPQRAAAAAAVARAAWPLCRGRRRR
eukprot:3248557-Pleurochrysis_carterae.AAC.2